MSEKQVQTQSPEIIDAAPDLNHYPIVAEGSGKTAANEGAQAKIVYNVRRVFYKSFCVADISDYRLSCSPLFKRPTSSHGQRHRSIFTVSTDSERNFGKNNRLVD